MTSFHGTIATLNARLLYAFCMLDCFVNCTIAIVACSANDGIRTLRDVWSQIRQYKEAASLLKKHEAALYNEGVK